MAAMHEHTAYAAHAADSPPPAAAAEMDAGDASVATDLYKAALGDVGVAHYLAAFARLDATGRVLSGWNWAAALCTLGWLVFWRLWSAALIYGLALATGLGLLAAAVLGGSAVPAPMLGGLALAGLLLLCVVPGMYGDALLHMALGQRVARAVQQAANLREAAGALREQAGTRSRLLAVALVGTLLLTLGAGVAWLLWSNATGQPITAAAPAPKAGAALAAPQAPSAPPSPADAPQAAAPAQPQVVDAAASAPAVAAPDAAMPQAPAPDAAAPGAAVTDTATPAAIADIATAAAPAAAPAHESVAPASAAPRLKADAAGTQDPPEPAHAPAPGKKARAARHAPAPAKAPVKAQAKAATPAGQAAPQRKLYVNVGTFGDADNARRAEASLREAGLPVHVRQMRGAGGRKLQSVRVGPFGSASQANEAARKARALGLEAVPDAQ
jgi:cell division protein FtsN